MLVPSVSVTALVVVGLVVFSQLVPRSNQHELVLLLEVVLLLLVEPLTDCRLLQLPNAAASTAAAAAAALTAAAAGSCRACGGS
jgi:hypothetical protein